MSRAYYNEIDPFAAQWLRNLIAAGHIAPGDVDERSIKDVTAEDIRGYTQCHFFAGIGVWSYALRRAGWSDDRPVWTGSCPCQPFSSTGKGEGFKDNRHLWPAWFRLISQCRPVEIFGEQVASKDGLAWLDLVQVNLQTAEYAVAAVDLCAAGVGAPHIRQRLWFVAQRLADTISQRSDWRGGGKHSIAETGRGETTVGAWDPKRIERLCSTSEMAGYESGGKTNGFWCDADWLLCFDGRWRPVEPGSFPLVNGTPARVGRLRAYGNAINAELAALFISTYLEII